MAAASAGSIQPGTVPINGAIQQPDHTTQQQQQQHQLHHHQFSQPQLHHQSSSSSFPSQQLLHQPPQQILQTSQFQPKHKYKYISRSNSGTNLNSIVENNNVLISGCSNNSNSSNSSHSSNNSSADSVASGYLNAPIKTSARHPNLVKHQQVVHQQLTKSNKTNSSSYLHQPNLAPGWRRLIANEEVIYVSPTGAALRNLGQIKDYLLSPGTCKCGLPCPLRAETFFDFDYQVPTKQSNTNLDSEMPRMPCSHQHHYQEHLNLAKRDVKRKKQSVEWTPPPSVSPVPVNVNETSSHTPASQMMVPSSVRFPINSSIAGLENAVENVTHHTQYLEQPSAAVTSASNVVYQSVPVESKPLSRTPPWRKNSSLNQPKSSCENTDQPIIVGYQHSEDRVPPLPQQHIPQQQQLPVQQHHTPPQTSQWQETTISNRQQPQSAAKSRVISKKCPTFKEDPTGYLNQQTALLHNSISTLHSPNGSPSIEANQKFTNQKPNPNHSLLAKTIKEEPGMEAVHSKFYQQPAAVIGGGAGVRSQQFHPDQMLQHQVPATVSSQIRQIIHNTEQNQLIINQRQQKADGQMFTNKIQQLQQQQQQPPLQVQQNCDNNNSTSQLQLQQQIQLRQQIQQFQRQTQQLQKSSESYQGFHESRHAGPGRPSNASKIPPQVVMTTNSRESPVSSSTTFSRATPDISSSTPDPKGPVQGGMISTSNNEPPGSTPSPAESPESLRSRTPSSSSSSNFCPPKLLASHGSHKNTITSVTAGKSSTSTSSVNQKSRPAENDGEPVPMDTQNIRIINHQSGSSNVILNTTNSALKNRNQVQQHCLPVSTNISNMQHVMSNSSGNSQLIMTSTGQILVMSPQQHQQTTVQHQGKPQQILINQSPNGNRTVMMHSPQQGMVINQTSSGNGTQFMNGQLIQNVGQQQQQQQTNNVVIQNSQVLQSGHNSSYVMNAPNMIINNSSLITNANTLIQNNQNQMLASGNSTKIISNNGNILTTNQTNMLTSNQPMMTTSNQIISTNSAGNIIHHHQQGMGQQTMVLNTMPNGTMVLQPHFTTMDGQMVINQDNNTTTYVQQQHGHILISPDSKRRAKKRKGSSSGSGSLTPQGLSPQQLQLSPTIHNPSGQPPVSPGVGTMMHIAPQYQQQSFQLSPGLTLVQKQNTGHPQQQILLQNGQTIIQPLNLIGQQLIIPAGMMVTPETTLVQIQNMAPCGSIITPQGMVLRTPSPQQKQFLSPNTGQQFIVNQNGQISPINQIYNTQVGLVMPGGGQSSATPTFVQQNTTIVQQQTTMMNSSGNNHPTIGGQQNIINDMNAGHSVSTQTAQAQAQQHSGSASPPDTTTHSPRSPDRPLSQRSGGSSDSMSMAMVHQVSSSEPDSVISPSAADSAQSPSNIDYSERGGGISYQRNSYKTSESKIRRIQTPTQFTSTILTTSHTNQTSSNNSMTPDSHESPQSSSNSNSPITTTYCIGELVWGAVRGHPAWPGKVINPPEGFNTPSDCAWVRWFGGRPNAEMVSTQTLKSLSDGLEAHHKAQKDTRKSRKLNSQLERAIQEAMVELDRASTANTTSPTVNSSTSIPSIYLTSPTSTTHRISNNNKGRRNQSSVPANLSPPATTHARHKPVKIAPAPPSAQHVNQQFKQQPLDQQK